ncbi:membrane protein [Tistrella bauzanensis]|uniref:Membrane protein n=1 Tax=Tistrella bauzanensis TaxID=657419 RepID=A0ABQ1IYN3_9PROT|nr:NfeD family protein [Tistrella bauzanensis]GGB55845.1 membrane protein [Tistrella bauzanensis]
MFGLAPLSPWIWLIIGAVLAAGELLMPGVFLLWFGLAALVTAGVSATVLPDTAGLSVQMLVFAAAAVVSVAAGWLSWHRSHPQQNTDAVGARQPDEELGDRRRFVIGRSGVVEEAIRSGRGRVRLGDGSWSATGPDLATGTPVTVVAMDGTVLQVVASDRRSG